MTLEGAYDEIFPGCHTVFHPAEVFMSFSPGKDKKAAFADFAPDGVSREDFPTEGKPISAIRESPYLWHSKPGCFAPPLLGSSSSRRS